MYHCRYAAVSGSARVDLKTHTVAMQCTAILHHREQAGGGVRGCDRRVHPSLQRGYGGASH
jgi:hypothetical protein